MSLTRRHTLAIASAPLLGGADAEYITLRHRDLSLAISPTHGAELASLRIAGRELLYRAQNYSPTKGWTGRAPWLWPAVGRNFAPGQKPDGGNQVVGSYDYQGQRYPLPIHGFARDHAWSIVTRSARHAEFSLADSPATRRFYPFGFRLHVEYRIELSSAIAIRFRVEASKQNHEPMFFSAGNHLSLAVPPETTFTTGSTRMIAKTPAGIPTGVTAPRAFPHPTQLSAIAAEYPLSLAGYAKQASLRLTDPTGLSLTLDHEADWLPPEPSLRFNLWGTADCFCPEPWVGLQNSFNLRQGLVYLDPGRAWNWRIRFTYSKRSASIGSTVAARRAGP